MQYHRNNDIYQNAPGPSGHTNVKVGSEAAITELVWCPCMVINVIVQHNGGFLPDILLLTQAPIFVWFDGNIILLLTFLLYTTVSSVLLCLVAPHDD